MEWETLRAEVFLFGVSLGVGIISLWPALTSEEKHRWQSDYLIKAAIWLMLAAYVVLFLH